MSKSIPVAGGMAGGSTDAAAAALVACNALWGLGLALDRCIELGAELGSDVPFGLHGGTALGASRGSAARCSPPARSCGSWRHRSPRYPPRDTATFDRLNATRGSTRLCPGRCWLRYGAATTEAVGTYLHNDLQAAAISMRPELDLLLEAGIDYGALGAMVSSSGRPACSWPRTRARDGTRGRRCPARDCTAVRDRHRPGSGARIPRAHGWGAGRATALSGQQVQGGNHVADPVGVISSTPGLVQALSSILAEANNEMSSLAELASPSALKWALPDVQAVILPSS